ncbi:uncharacterized protein TNCV_4217001 [Trichonephila clavipes]|nr:uncharacterized protein TNCV_4217001 [Trichonephila clavipes]
MFSKHSSFLQIFKTVGVLNIHRAYRVKRLSSAGSTEVQAACRRSTKSVCAVITSPYTKSLRFPNRKKFIGETSGDHSGHRTGPPSKLVTGVCHTQPIMYRSRETRWSPTMIHYASSFNCIFLVNYGSYRYSSLGIFYVHPTRNLGAIFGTPCIQLRLLRA